MATAGSENITSTGKNVYEDANGCTSFIVIVTAASSFDALVNIPGLHDSGEFFTVQPGTEYVFRLNHMGIKEVFVKGDSGTAAVIYGVVGITWSEG
tara:strand:- start:2315 stop:2602 length:288 start_codon:yes stop_codon:yes gene_type:complete